MGINEKEKPGGKTRRVYSGVTDTGRRFAILYRTTGVEWMWGRDAEKMQALVKPSHEAKSTPTKRPTPAADALALMDGAAGFMGAAAQLMNSVNDALWWWEARQRRLTDEARFEESRRLPWLIEMLDRWITAHEDKRHLDLEISHYLGREASTTLKALVDNKKMSLPAVLLYDLARVRSVISSGRILLGAQFDALRMSEHFNPDAIVAGSFQSGSGENAILDYRAIRSWASDPAEDWARLTIAGRLEDFETEIREMHLKPGRFIERAFGIENKADEKDEASLLDLDLRSWTPFALGVTAGAMRSSPLGMIGLFVASQAVESISEYLKKMDDKRREDFRELALLSAEIERTRLLHRLWCIFDGMVRSQKGAGLLVDEDNGILSIYRPARIETGAGFSYEKIADWNMREVTDPSLVLGARL